MQIDWYARARAILNRDWDPIHLSRSRKLDAESWADEYDHYRDVLAVLIRAGASDSVLFAYLEWAEIGAIELGPIDPARNLKVMTAIRALGPPPPPDRRR